MFKPVISFFSLTFFCLQINASNFSTHLNDSQVEQLGQIIWQNEGAGKIDNLTVWNKNEAFPSFGIGHFIWYPTATKGPYVEQFPALITYLLQHQVVIPEWLENSKLAPWPSRESFYANYQGKQLTELRALLYQTRNSQTKFIILRLQSALPAIMQNSSEQQQAKIEKQLQELIKTPEGVFAVIDYVNFKGEGISEKEQYQGHGWGLKQVLLAMPDQSTNPLLSFSLAADEVLTRRVKNAPRDELDWLKGWRVRVHKYTDLSLGD